MLKIALIVLLYFFANLTFLSRPVLASLECTDVVSKSAIIRLRKHLLCDHEWKIGTTLNPNNKTIVWVSVAPKSVLFDDATGNMKLHGRLILSWVDKHLSWNASSFDDVKRLRLRSSEIWVPDIAVQSSGNWKFDQPGLRPSPCDLENNGWVTCLSPIDYKIRCQTDFTMWPFDRQNCTFLLASWSHTGDEIAISGQLFSSLNPDMFQSNGEWEVTVSRIAFENKKTIYLENGTSSIMAMDFIMDRAHNHLSGLFVSPAIIVMVMTLTTLWLDPRSIERVALACLNPMIHLLCIQYLHWSLPHNGITVPNILTFYADSLVLATLTLLLTFLLGKIHETKISAPKWISSLTSLILRSKVGQILLRSMLDPKAADGIEDNVDDTDNLVHSDTKEPSWNYVANLLSWISLISFFFAYVVMYTVLIPNSSMRPPVAAGQIPYV